MSLLGKLFGSDKAIDKVTNTASRLLDDAFYTKEEQAADRAKATTEARGLVIEWLKATTGSRLARRVIAISVTSVWLLTHVVGMILAIATAFVDTATAAQLASAVDIIDNRSDGMTGAVMLILSFYFAAPHAGDIARAALERFGNKP
ncbi:MAG: hypothetical protein AAGB14_15900 [Verrucomicrobiota bacterium]